MTIGIGIYRWQSLGRADRIPVLQVTCALVAELIAFIAYRRSHNSLAVYHVYSPVEFLLVSLYFNQSIRLFRRRNIGLIAGMSGIVLSICNTRFLQPFTSINSYFLLFEGAMIIVYCLVAFHQVLLDEESLPYRFAGFWLTTAFMVFWSLTFTGWGIYTILNNKDHLLVRAFDHVLAAANFIFYTGIALIFLNYRKLIPSGE